MVLHTSGMRADDQYFRAFFFKPDFGIHYFHIFKIEVHENHNRFVHQARSKLHFVYKIRSLSVALLALGSHESGKRYAAEQLAFVVKVDDG